MTERNTRLLGEAKLPEDLSVLERRGALGASERRRLEMALAASDALACTHGLGRDFDALDTQCKGDAELIARVVERSKARYGRPVPVRARSRIQAALPWLASISLLLVAMAAGATLWPLTKRFLTGGVEPLPSSVRGPNQSSRSSRSEAAKSSAAYEMAITDDDTSPGTVARSASDLDDMGARAAAKVKPDNEGEKSGTRAVTASGTDARLLAPSFARDVVATSRTNQSGRAVLADGLPYGSTGVVKEAQASRMDGEEEPERAISASELFRAANLARRHGDTQRARALYAELRSAYPAANEAALSCVMVGRMDLQAGAAANALRQFQQYLSLAPAGPLVEEALAGEAAAYRELSRPAEESATWRALLSRFPHSVYATAAHERLEALR